MEHPNTRGTPLQSQQTQSDDQKLFAALSEQQLIEAAKSDPNALSYLYRNHYAPIFGYVNRRVGDTNDTHDIVSEVFVSMVRNLPSFRWTGAPFRCWLLRLATTQISRWIRKRRWVKYFQAFDETKYEKTPKEDVIDERLEHVRQALLSLPIVFQSAIALHYFEELPVETVAQILNCRAGTIKSRLSRGRDLLRKKLSNHEETASNEPRAIGILPEQVEV